MSAQSETFLWMNLGKGVCAREDDERKARRAQQQQQQQEEDNKKINKAPQAAEGKGEPDAAAAPAAAA
eukprot:CAMPEP_0167831234 /NCGR_PEP_ID=MMETSP0112_2-20121227/13480_1 /TAXON_ID=91324 /ORGANISM="Lotharella globosa, Strain CCCM811" /LENGTH=67 /DNA_ID=CAMNT_0007735773 /DNA_START=669 /DNA_END=870 /DNA_ORIENTATION=+